MFTKDRAVALKCKLQLFQLQLHYIFKTGNIHYANKHTTRTHSVYFQFNTFKCNFTSWIVSFQTTYIFNHKVIRNITLHCMNLSLNLPETVIKMKYKAHQPEQSMQRSRNLKHIFPRCLTI